MLAVVAAAAAEDRPLLGGSLELRVGENRCQGRAKLFFEGTRVGRDLPGDQSFECLVDLEQLGDETPAPVEPVAHALRALLGAVAEPHRPFRGELAMIGDFLDRLGGELAQELVRRTRQPLQQHVLPGGIEQVPGDGLGEVAVGLLDQEAVAEIENVAVEGERVAVAALVLAFAGCAEQVGRLTDQVERQVGETEVDLERGRVAAPFAEALAEHQSIVAEPKQVIVPRGVRLGGRRRVERAFAGRVRRHIDRRQRGHQMCFTSSGMS